MRLVRILIGACAFTGIAGTARAAYVSEVLTAVEKQRTLPDVNVEVGWDRLLEQGKITREWIQDTNGLKEALDVKELRYKEETMRLLLGLRVGIYHDLEFHLLAPIILNDQSDIWFAKGVSGVSTITGSTNANDPTYPQGNDVCCARYPLTDVPGSRVRSGFGDMLFGLSWSPVVDKKDEAYPTMTFRGDIIAPTGKVRDPTEQSAIPDKNLGSGSVGLGLTVFDLSMALAKRMREETPTFDPYMVFGASIPIPTSSQKSRGMDPPASGRFLVGAELIVDEDPETFQKYAIDISFGVKYTGRGRTYSELSDYLPGFDQTRVPNEKIGYGDFNNKANYHVNNDAASCGPLLQGVPCGTFTTVDEYLQMQGTLAINIKPAKYAFFRGGLSFGVNTDHFLTTEKVGTDTDPASAANQTCDGAPCVGRVNVRNSLGQDERSPYYDPRFDTPGHRFRIEEATLFTVFVMGGATF